MTYDVAVIGVGSMGASTCLALAKRGVKVVGLEQFELGHRNGSAHGLARLFRMSYFEHNDYVPLLKTSYDLWKEWGELSGEELLILNGLILFGPQDSEIQQGVRSSAKEHELKIEDIDLTSANKRFPEFKINQGMHGIYDSRAGYLLVDRAVKQMTKLAIQNGAEIKERTKLVSWKKQGAEFHVATDEETITAKKIIFTAGAWTQGLLNDLGMELKIYRNWLYWFGLKDKGAYPNPDFPCYAFETPEGFFYGIPDVDNRGIRVALHLPGEPMARPSELNDQECGEDMPLVEDFVAKHMKGVDPIPCETAPCIYTMSRDQHFIIDKHPGIEGVALAGGFSGHGFKFAPAVGEILADYVLEGKTEHPAGFLGLKNRISI